MVGVVLHGPAARGEQRGAARSQHVLALVDVARPRRAEAVAVGVRSPDREDELVEGEAVAACVALRGAAHPAAVRHTPLQAEHVVPVRLGLAVGGPVPVDRVPPTVLGMPLPRPDQRVTAAPVQADLDRDGPGAADPVAESHAAAAGREDAARAGR